MQCTVEDAAAAFHLRGRTIKKASLAVRQYLLLLARPLPWFSALTLQTVVSRAEAIIHADTVHRMVVASTRKGARICQAAVKELQGQAEGSASLPESVAGADDPARASAAGDSIAAVTAVSEKPHSPAEGGQKALLGQQKRMVGSDVLQNPCPDKRSRVGE